MKLKTGDFVVLKKKAVKEFYGTGDRPLDFGRGGYSWDNFDSRAFVEFVGDWLGFSSGEGVGVVINVDKNNEDINVVFENKVTLELEYLYYDVNDLQKVKVEVINGRVFRS